MSAAVVEVGPTAVCGPKCPEPELVSAALEAIDDGLTLLEERAVSVPELWAELLRVAIAGADSVVLVCPTWWPHPRIDRVRAAAAKSATTVEVVGRTAVLHRETRATVVEIAPELVVVTRAGAHAVVIPNCDDEIAAKVTAAVGPAGPVLVDVPASMRAGPLADGIVKQLRRSAVSAHLAHEDAVHRAAARSVPSDEVVPGPDGGNRRRLVAMAGAVVAAVAVICGLGLHGTADVSDSSATLLVEGRIEVLVPASWPVQRITSGPGSARLEVTSPSDDDVSLHLTQSLGPAQADLTQTAAALGTALADEPSDVFVDFDPAGSAAGRSAVTYRELRPDHHVVWAVLMDRGVRIAIGCQSGPGREYTVRDVCDRAITSARATA